MTNERPSWQTEDCPSWCVKEHHEDDRNGDRDHTSEPIYMPVIQLIRRYGSDGEYIRYAKADEIIAVLFQGVDDSHPWLSFGVAENAATEMELSLDAASRLMATLARLVSLGV